ncbi:hypothetical protein [Nannocystis sp.]|uniref:hypothetical protein n=1 Tax=Nannocystis sp. TaxID=1962667 RepID=UPI0025D3986C|nr:hypothetical protein [Nannocystis sp.]MBK7828606.1 hypothetical protein [Nannocystis sp.]
MDRVMQCVEQFPYIQSCVARVEGQCRTVSQRCDATDMFLSGVCLPGAGELLAAHA